MGRRVADGAGVGRGQGMGAAEVEGRQEGAMVAGARMGRTVEGMGGAEEVGVARGWEEGVMVNQSCRWQ